MQRLTWTNRLTYILTVAGATIGFGATWRFPYMVGQNGGGAYVAVFCLAMFLVGVPMILVENVIGRRGKCDAFSTFSSSRDGYKPNAAWRILGAMSLLGSFAIMAFYMVLGAWVISYIVNIIASFFGSGLELFSPIKASYAREFFTSSIEQNPQMISFFTLIFVLINYIILKKGIIAGIEQSVKYLMPLLFLCLIALVVRNLTLSGSAEGVRFYLYPDISKINAKLLLDVLGQVFFALSLGFGVMITLSSHLNSDEDMLKTSAITGVINTLIAVLAGFMIFPSLATFGVAPEQGPTLVFQTLPVVFSHMHFGAIFAILFFALLLLAALTTTLPIYQVIITALHERWGFSQHRAIVFTLAAIFVLGNIPSIFSEEIFNFYDFISGNILFTLTGLGCVLFVGWGMGKERAINELSNHKNLDRKINSAWFFYVKFILPIIILAIFLAGVF